LIVLYVGTSSNTALPQLCQYACGSDAAVIPRTLCATLVILFYLEYMKVFGYGVAPGLRFNLGTMNVSALSDNMYA